MYRQTGVRKDPHRASTAGHRVGVGTSWKGLWGPKKSVLSEDLELLPEHEGVGAGGVHEGLKQVGELCRQEGELCRQQHGSLIRTHLKS